MADPGGGLSTLPSPAEAGPERARRDRLIRRAVLGAIAVMLALGVANVFGSREETAASAGGGYELEVTHPAATRSGLSIEWRATVRRPGGFRGPVTLAVSGELFDLLDEHGIHPEPSAVRGAGDDVIWEFERPRSDTLVVRFDGRVDPSKRGRRSVTTAVMEGGRPAAEVRYDVTVLP